MRKIVVLRLCSKCPVLSFWSSWTSTLSIQLNRQATVNKVHVSFLSLIDRIFFLIISHTGHFTLLCLPGVCWSSHALHSVRKRHRGLGGGCELTSAPSVPSTNGPKNDLFKLIPMSQRSLLGIATSGAEPQTAALS